RGAIKAKTNRKSIPPRFTRLPTQKDITDLQLTEANDFIREFTVKGPKQGVYNGGIAVTLTCANVQGVGRCALTGAHLQRRATGPHRDESEGEWETVNSYFNQSPIYIQAGQALHANLPTPGRWRVIIEGANTTDIFTGDIDFTREKGWPDPGQIGYRATNMKFWKMLKRFARPGLRKVRPTEVLGGNQWKRNDTIVITNKVYGKPYVRRLKKWVRRGGNLVLTDKALKMLASFGLVPKGAIGSANYYAGYANFATPAKEQTYKMPLARKINQPGAAEGGQEEDDALEGEEVHRHQTYEPVPLGIAIQTPDGDDAYNSPVWHVNWNDLRKLKKHRRKLVASTGGLEQISFGEIRLGRGRIRFIGGVLPMPTKAFDHPFGLASYALTYSGYQMLQNALTWDKPRA
ncbi:MAG: hypothetical protein M3238_07890, partial [Actinomycetota bacterium]|nr:hypothetical protein [Actinomycetota bacterium]